MSNKIKTKQNNKKAKFNKYFDEDNDTTNEVINYLVAIFGVILCTALTLYMRNGYIGDNALKKITVYKWIVSIGIAVIGAFIIYYVCNKLPKENWRLYNVDYFAIGFVLMSFISSIVGGNFAECVIGYDGWYMGILSQVSFVLLYMLFSRFSRYYKVIIGAILASAAIAFIIAICQRCMIDPCDFYYLGDEAELDKLQKNDFISTMGQVSWYSGFVATVFPIGVGAFWASDNRKIRVSTGVFSLLAFMTLVSQNSDSAYMAMLGFFMVFFLFSTSDGKRMIRFWEILSLFLISTRITKLLLIIHPNDELMLDTFSDFMINNNNVWTITLCVVLITIGMHVIINKKGEYHARFWKGLSFAILGLIIMGVITSTIILILSATGNTPNWLAKITAPISYLNWNDDWGNHRGMSWTINLWMLRDMDPINKLFGIGPDNYPYVAYELYSDELLNMFDATLSNAHNECAMILISFGLVGFVCYYGFFVAAIKNFAKKQKDQPLFVGFIATIVSYIAHNFFCYQTVCCTPFLFIIVAMGIFLYRREIRYDEYQSIISKIKKRFAKSDSE